DACHDPVGGQIAGERVGEETVFDERTFVEQAREPVTDEQLVLGRELVGFLGKVALPRAFGVLGEAFEVVGTVGAHDPYLLARGPACSKALGSSRPTISC